MYTLVLTHDIDCLSLKEFPWMHKTLWGFSYHCLKAAVSPRGIRYSLRQRAMLVWDCVSMPLIKLGLRNDPWAESFALMIATERRLGVRSTLYFLPFPNRAGVTPLGTEAPANRSIYYDVRKEGAMIRALERDGWEIGVHGIDAYWDDTAARQEKQVIEEILGHDKIGIRMHWLYSRDQATWKLLSRTGYAYDATLGWNQAVGFPGGHYTPFRPIDGEPFMLLPLNIQDQALFQEMKLSEEEAWVKASEVIAKANAHDAVVTLLWHNNSFVAPAHWGAMYERIIRQAQADGARIIRAIDAVTDTVDESATAAALKHHGRRG